jgi:ubiquinone/menaquinone biosynthesis C-methylase UbiE
MKDIVANRQRIGLGQKFKQGLIVLRENGLIWTSWLGIYYFGSSLAEAAFNRMHARARRLGLPGTSSASMNREVWNSWDWKAGGEEWTLSPEWKQSLVRQVLRKYIPAGKDVLEIGPGAGRWTEFLQPMSRSLVGVDISQQCVDICSKKFGGSGNARFLTSNGNNLNGVADQSVDAIWSFDVFVHIDAADAAGYVKEFRRVLRPGGVGVVHHGKEPELGGWRSNLTIGKFRELLETNGFTVVEQFEHWKENGQTLPVGRYEDIVTVFRL